MGDSTQGSCDQGSEGEGCHPAVERWLPCYRLVGYFVSDFGCVRKNGAGQNMSQTQTKGGYRTVNIHGEARRVHRLVLEAFVGLCPPGMECAHRDCNPSNNSLENLRWTTHKDNAADTIRLGRFPRGSRQGRAKLTEEVVLEARRRYAKGGISIPTLAAEMGVSTAVAQFAVTGRTWRHVPEITNPAGTNKGKNVARGEGHHLARLTEADVLEMRGLFRSRDYTKRALAKMFNIHYNTCIQALSGFTWKHL